MQYSINEYVYEGGPQEFDINFALGFDRADVNAQIAPRDLYEAPTPLGIVWLTNSRVRLTPANSIEIGRNVQIQRTVAKDKLPWDFTAPDGVRRESLNYSFTHLLYAIHELLDGRAQGVGDAVLASRQIEEWYEEFKRGVYKVQQVFETVAGQSSYLIDRAGNKLNLTGSNQTVFCGEVAMGPLVLGDDYEVIQNSVDPNYRGLKFLKPVEAGWLVNVISETRASDSEAQAMIDAAQTIVNSVLPKAEAAAARAEVWGPRTFSSVADMLASADLTPDNTPVGSTIGVRQSGDSNRVYDVVLSGGSLTAGGIRVDVQPAPNELIKPVSDRSVRVFDILASPVKPQFMTGYSSAWNGDCTVAMQAAMQWAVDQNRTLRIDEPATVSELYMLPGQRIEWDAKRYDVVSGKGAGLRLKRGTGSALYSTSPYMLSLYHSGTPSDWSYKGVELYNPVLFGDMWQNKATDNSQRFCGGISIENSPSPDASINPRHKIIGGFLREIAGDAVRIGGRTYDGQYKDGTVYSCLGHGIYYGGVDSEISGWNIGRTYGHSMFFRGGELRLSNIKGWLAGYVDTTAPDVNPMYNPEINPLNSASFYFFRSRGIVGTNLMSQEAANFGVQFANSGEVSAGVPWYLEDIHLSNVDVDGSNRKGLATAAGVELRQARRCSVQASVGKRNTAFLGGATRGIAVYDSTHTCSIDVYADVSSWVASPDSIFEGNTWKLNDHSSKTLNRSVISSYVPNPFDAVGHRLTMGESALNIPNPTHVPNGFELKFEFIQTSATPRAITFGSAYKLPSSWAPTTTQGKRAMIAFKSDGTSWVATNFVNEV